MYNYRILSVIGEGTYGKVFKAQAKDDGRVVAIKKFKQDEDEDPHVRKTMMREIKVLKEFRHVNIVNLRDVFREKGKLFLIFDYVEKTLLEELQQSPSGLKMAKIKEIVYQILQANHFLHTNNIIHRDIKPENLLISKNGVVKLCDFGFARPMRKEEGYRYTDYVSTRWYRAPELLVGDAAYNESVDVWAFGCIFAEIFNGMPLFPGDSDLHTLQLILETITADDMENNRPIQELSKKQRIAFRMNPLFDGMKAPLASEAVKAPEHASEVSLNALLKDMDENSLDFIRNCLVIDGNLRCKTSFLLNHPLFDKEFLDGFEQKLQQMQEADVIEEKKLMQTRLQTKDGEDELDPELLYIQSEKDDSNNEGNEEEEDEDDEDFEEDDDDSSPQDSSSGVGNRENKSNCIQTEITDSAGLQYQRRTGKRQEKEINGDLADVDITQKSQNNKRNTEINNSLAVKVCDDFANQNSSGIHGSSGIGYDSEDYYQAVNLQIDTSETVTKNEEEFGPVDSPGAQYVIQLYPESGEIKKKSEFDQQKMVSNKKPQPQIFDSPEATKTSNVKRLSINHFKIESSINEEIKEEHSDSSSGTPEQLLSQQFLQNEAGQEFQFLVLHDPQSDVKTYQSPQFLKSVDESNSSFAKGQLVQVLSVSPGHKEQQLRKFELSEQSHNTIEKDDDEIGSHLLKQTGNDKNARKPELMTNVGIMNIGKQQVLTDSQTSLYKTNSNTLQQEYLAASSTNGQNQSTKISKVNITFGVNAPPRLSHKNSEGIQISNEIQQKDPNQNSTYEENTFESLNSLMQQKGKIQQRSNGNFQISQTTSQQNQTARELSQAKSNTVKQNIAVGFSGMISGNAFFGQQSKVQPAYQLIYHPNSQQKAPSWKQQTILKQTASLEKFKKGPIQAGLPNVKVAHSSLSQYNNPQEQVQHQVLQSTENNTFQNVLISSQQFSGIQSLKIKNQIPQSLTQPRHANGHPKFSSTSQDQMNMTNQNYHRSQASQYSDNIQALPHFSPITGKINQTRDLLPKLNQENIHSNFAKTHNQDPLLLNKQKSTSPAQFTPQQNQKRKFYELTTQKQMYSESQAYGKNHPAIALQVQNIPTSYSRSTNPLNNKAGTQITTISKKYININKEQNTIAQSCQGSGQHPKRYAGSELKHSHRIWTEEGSGVIMTDEYMLKKDTNTQVEMAQRPSIRSNNEGRAAPPPMNNYNKPDFSSVNVGTSLLANKQKSAVVVQTFSCQTDANTSMISVGTNNPAPKKVFTEQKQPPNKFIQSFQHHGPASNQTNTLVIKNSSHIAGPLASNGFSVVSQNQTFEKDSFPKRNITNKLRNAQNTQQKVNKMAARGSSMNDCNQIVILPISSSPKTNIVTLPNLQGQHQSGGQQGKQFPLTPHKGQTFQAPNSQQYQNQNTQQQQSMGIYESTQYAQSNIYHANSLHRSFVPQKQKPVGLQLTQSQIQANDLNVKLSSKNAVHQQQLLHKPSQVPQVVTSSNSRSDQRHHNYQMYQTPSQNYNSGATTLVDAAARASVIKPIGSENQLKKLSHQKLVAVSSSVGSQNKHQKQLQSPQSPKNKVKTETNWNNSNQKDKFAVYDKQINASYSIFNNKLGSQDIGISPIRVNIKTNENVNFTNTPHLVEQQGTNFQANYVSRLILQSGIRQKFGFTNENEIKFI